MKPSALLASFVSKCHQLAFSNQQFEDSDRSRLSCACADVHAFVVLALVLHLLSSEWNRVGRLTSILMAAYLLAYLVVERWGIFKNLAQTLVLIHVAVIGAFGLDLIQPIFTVASTRSVILCYGLAYLTIALGPRFGFGGLLTYIGLLCLEYSIDNSIYMHSIVVTSGYLVLLFLGCALLRLRLVETLSCAFKERNESKAALEHLNQRLEELMHARSTQLNERMEMAMLAIGTLAHEFRTPLASLRMTNEYMQNVIETSDHGLTNFLPLLKNTEQILGRMNKHIDSSMVNVGVLLKGHLQLPVCRVDIGAIVQDALKVNQMFFQTAGEINVRLEDDCWARADPVMLEHVFVNLMSNAVKALAAQKKRRPGPQIEVELLKKKLRIILRVSDKGVGIPQHQQDRIFDPFYSSNGTPSQGLGLTMVKKAVHAMGGAIKCVSDVEVGTTFEVRLNVCDSNTTLSSSTWFPNADRRMSKRDR